MENVKKQKILISEHEIVFSLSDNIWLSNIKHNKRNLRFRIDEKKYFKNIDWCKITDFICFFLQNAEDYVQKSQEPLKTLARMTTFFKEIEIENAIFTLIEIEILNNHFSLEGKWNFELIFAFENPYIYHIDTYGRWFVTFCNNYIVGIRRESV